MRRSSATARRRSVITSAGNSVSATSPRASSTAYSFRSSRTESAACRSTEAGDKHVSLRLCGGFIIVATMKKLKAFIAESVSAEEFYNRDWEGHVAKEIVRLLDGKASYRIVLNNKLLCRAIESASENAYDVFHLSCHGSKKGVRLTDGTRLSWAASRGISDAIAEPSATTVDSTKPHNFAVYILSILKSIDK